MKKLFLILLFLLPTFAFAQDNWTSQNWVDVINAVGNACENSNYNYNSSVICNNEKTWIKENFEGKVILTPEYIIEVPSYDSYDSRYWSKMDNIIILDDYSMINTDTGEKVEIKSIHRR